MSFDLSAPSSDPVHLPNASSCVSVGQLSYRNVVCANPDREFAYALGGGYRWFDAWVGLDQERELGAIRFRVYADEELAFDTGDLNYGDRGDLTYGPRPTNPHRPIRCLVPLDGVRQLRLVITGGPECAGCWADAKLWRSSIPFPNAPAYAGRDGLAKTPPMGWNSWCGVGHEVDEKVVRDAADGMVCSGMRDAGYEYVVIDDWWSVKAGRDAGGNLQADPQKFASGIKALADYVHSRGLKFGIYTDAKCLTCGGFPGSYGHYEQDARLFADWGVDFVKVDWGGQPDLPAPQLYAEFSQALRASGRPIALNICEWGVREPWSWAREAGGHMWRTTFDLVDRWDTPTDSNSGLGIIRMIDQNEALGRFAGPGGWNDLDQLFVGLYGRQYNSHGTRAGSPKGPGCSDLEYRSQMSMWCLLAAPLVAGCSLLEMNEPTRETLTNREAIAVDQDPLGIPGWRAQKMGELEVWQKPLSGGDIAVGLFNRGDVEQVITARWRSLAISDSWEVRDLWAHRDLGRFEGNFSRSVAPHEVVLLRLSS